MTRIYDALRKARTSRPHPDAGARPPSGPAPVRPPHGVPPVVPRPTALRPMTASPAPLQAFPAGLGITAATAAVRAPGAAQAVVPIQGPEVSESVVREMTALRMNLEASLRERLPRAVMFMSAQGGEGTTSVALQFAATLAAGERLRVVLVDLHARRSGFADADSPSGTGERFDFLPLGDHAAGGSISAGSARDLIDSLAGGYDWIVLDGPPALESPDAGPLSAIADGVVMVIQAGRAKRPVLNRAVDLLRKSGANLVGSVLNRRRLEIPEFIYRRI